MVSLQYLTYFMKICETNSMNKTADALFISQPALSQAIKNLESELNVTLMTRSNRGIRLTEEGEKLYRHADLILQQFALIDNLAEEDIHNSLSISAFPHLVHPDVLYHLKALPAFSSCQLNFDECRVSEILENIDKLRSDIGIIQYNNRQAGILKKKLAFMNLEFHLIDTKPWAIAVGGHSPLCHRSEVTLSELKPYRQIRLKDDYFSFMTGEIKVQDVSLGQMEADNIQSSMLTQYLLQHTDMYLFCSLHNRVLEELCGLHLIPLKDVDITISLGWIKKKNHLLGDFEESFIDLLTADITGNTPL